MAKTYKEVLFENGFYYDETNDIYKKALGFGQFITVELVCSTLFTVKKKEKIVFDHFVSSFSEFKEIIQKVLA